eukprot:6711804-Ditylum_brightwellii.AAC.1
MAAVIMEALTTAISTSNREESLPVDNTIVVKWSSIFLEISTAPCLLLQEKGEVVLLMKHHPVPNVPGKLTTMIVGRAKMASGSTTAMGLWDKRTGAPIIPRVAFESVRVVK